MDTTYQSFTERPVGLISYTVIIPLQVLSLLWHCILHLLQAFFTLLRNIRFLIKCLIYLRQVFTIQGPSRYDRPCFSFKSILYLRFIYRKDFNYEHLVEPSYSVCLPVQAMIALNLSSLPQETKGQHRIRSFSTYLTLVLRSVLFSWCNTLVKHLSLYHCIGEPCWLQLVSRFIRVLNLSYLFQSLVTKRS